jgi:hypothetical protein
MNAPSGAPLSPPAHPHRRIVGAALDTTRLPVHHVPTPTRPVPRPSAPFCRTREGRP